MNGGSFRPTYETNYNRSKEDEVSDRLRRLWEMEIEKLKPYFPADVAVISNDSTVVAFCEIKCRTNDMTAYPTYMVSVHKLYELASLASFTEIPSLLVVEWSDCLGYWKVPETLKGIETGIGGTKKRGDPQDIEPVAYIPIGDFKVLEKQE